MHLANHSSAPSKICTCSMADGQYETRIVLSHFFDIMFPAAILFGGTALAASLYRSFQQGWYGTAVLHMGIYGLALIVLRIRRKIPVLYLFTAMLILMAISSTYSLATLGITGEGLMTLAVTGVFSGLFFRRNVGLAICLAGAGAASLIGAGVCTGMIQLKPNLVQYMDDPFTWGLLIAMLLLYAVPLILAIDYMQTRMMTSLTAAHALNEQLVSEIATRVSVENELRLSEVKYRNIFENAMEGIFQFTLDGSYASVNPSLVKMFGFSSSEELIAAATEFFGVFIIDREDRVQLRTLLNRQDSVEAFETRMFKKDNTAIWVSVNAKKVRLNDRVLIEGTIEDITQRKKTEKALYESELKYRSVVENALVGFYILQDETFRYVNPRFCVITGYAYDEIVGKLGPGDFADASEIGKMMPPPGPEGRGEEEVKIKKKNGTFITAKVMVNSFLFYQKPAVFGTLLDISHEKFLETKLLQSDKMEAIGAFAGGIVHDFNNILTLLSGYGSLLKAKMQETDPLMSYVEHILTASGKAADLTQSLLTFSRLQPMALKPIDLNASILNTEKLLRRMITEDISFETNLSSEALIVLADKTQIDQILFNLVSNARDAMPAGGCLKVRTGIFNMDDGFIYAHGFGKKGRYVWMSVADTGVGMDDKTLQNMFDPFFTTKEAGKGTGLGLSTVYGIVKQHNGYIAASSQVGQGTCFDIYLPEARGAVDRDRLPPDYARTGKETILVAEDSDQVRRLIKDILHGQGYRVIEAADGIQAVDEFMQHEAIAMVLLDAIMPGKNGNDVYAAISKTRPEVPVLFMSGYTREEIVRRGMLTHDLPFISKPISPDELLKRVGELLEGADAHPHASQDKPV